MKGGMRLLGYRDFLKQLFPNSHNVEGEVYTALLGAVGFALDNLDPVQNNLSTAFCITTAVGTDLDLHGNDWGIVRRYQESDDSFRQRLLSLLPIYTKGPTLSGIKTVLSAFTGAEPDIFEYGPSLFIMGESAIAEAGFGTAADIFTFEVSINNPNGVSYNHRDMETTLKNSKLSRSTCILHHNGKDTSTLDQSPTAVITIT